MKYTGVVDLFRVAKPGAAIYQAQVDPRVKPVIAPAFYWDFGPASAGDEPAERDDLRQPRPARGVRRRGALRDAHARHRRLREPGVPAVVRRLQRGGRLVAAGPADRRLPGADLVASRSLASDPSFDRLALAFDDAEIDGDGVDATRLAFRAVDRYGAPGPTSPGRSRCRSTGRPCWSATTRSTSRAAGGAGAVWIRSLPGSAGTVTVSASHPVLGRAVARVRVR